MSLKSGVLSKNKSNTMGWKSETCISLPALIQSSYVIAKKKNWPLWVSSSWTLFLYLPCKDRSRGSLWLPSTWPSSWSQSGYLHLNVIKTINKWLTNAIILINWSTSVWLNETFLFRKHKDLQPPRNRIHVKGLTYRQLQNKYRD